MRLYIASKMIFKHFERFKTLLKLHWHTKLQLNFALIFKNIFRKNITFHLLFKTYYSRADI